VKSIDRPKTYPVTVHGLADIYEPALLSIVSYLHWMPY
jgi:hypothetical protein